MAFNEAEETIEPLAVLPLSTVADCYNFMLEASPLVLTRSAHDNRFHIRWPERRDFVVEDNEYFEFREENKLYPSILYGDPDYREKVLVRDFDTGEVLEIVLEALLQEFINGVVSKRISKQSRIICITVAKVKLILIE